MKPLTDRQVEALGALLERGGVRQTHVFMRECGVYRSTLQALTRRGLVKPIVHRFAGRRDTLHFTKITDEGREALEVYAA